MMRNRSAHGRGHLNRLRPLGRITPDHRALRQIRGQADVFSRYTLWNGRIGEIRPLIGLGL